MSRHRAFVIVSVGLLSAACNDEPIDPALPSASAQPTQSAPPDGSGGAPPEQPPVRDVYLRNPLGTRPDNLMADGDFELSIVGSLPFGLYGWLGFDKSAAPQVIAAETGGICKSSLRCARVPKESILYGRGVAAPNEAPLEASIWMKLVDPSTANAANPCLLGNATIIACETGEQIAHLKPAEKPDENGWCQISGAVRGSTLSLCMYVDIGTKDVLVDEATLLPSAQTDAGPNPKPPPLDEPTRARLSTIVDYVHKHTIFGPAPEAPARPKL